MKNHTNKNKSWNIRIPIEYHLNINIVKGHTGFTKDNIAQLALAVLFGVDAGDPTSPVNHNWKKCQEVFKKHGVKNLPTIMLSP